MLATLSTGHKLGLGLVGLAFVLFALSSSFLLPRLKPNFPGDRGLRLFLVVAVAFTVAMLAAVEVFGREASEAKAGAKLVVPPGAVRVKEVDFKITFFSTAVRPGKDTFLIENGGPSAHNLAIVGPGVLAQSPTIPAGKTTILTASFRKGTYDFFCSVPGHKQLGMNVVVKVR